MADITRPLMLDSTGQQIANAIQNTILAVPIVDNLNTADPSKALSANQGKILNDERVRHTSDVAAGAVPINADQLNGHPDSYFTATLCLQRDIHRTRTDSYSVTSNGIYLVVINVEVASSSNSHTVKILRNATVIYAQFHTSGLTSFTEVFPVQCSAGDTISFTIDNDPYTDGTSYISQWSIIKL